TAPPPPHPPPLHDALPISSMTADATRAEFRPSCYSGEPTGAAVPSASDHAPRDPIAVAKRHRAAAASRGQIECRGGRPSARHGRSEEHTSELPSLTHLVCP